MREKLTAIIPTYNEEDNIEECLKSVDFADEIIVVDSFSTDRTPEIAKKYATKFVQHEYGYSARQKNWIIPQAKYEWILLVDADERVTPQLREEILRELESPRYDAYWIRRRNFFWNKEIRYGSWGRDKVIRLFRRDLSRYEDKEVHAEIIVDGKVGFLKEKLLHYTYKGLDDYLKRLNRYSVWGANQRLKEGWKGRWYHVVLYPPFTFLRNYVVNLGFLDGLEGFVVEALNSYYVFLKYLRLWEKTKYF